MNKRIIGFIFCLILFNVQMFANEIGLRVLGNDQDGYYVNIYWGKQLISDQSRSGELEAYFDNEDYAVREMLQGWKATQVKKRKWEDYTFRAGLFKKIGNRFICECYL